MTNRRASQQRRNSQRSGSETRELRDLVSIGPAMLRDFETIGVRSVAQLARLKPEALYEKLCQATGQSHDICCLDVFSAAVAQARDPKLPKEQRQWRYWSRVRQKAGR
jgi:hypothetical protein